MDRFNRNNRIVAITQILLNNPSRVISLNNFLEPLNAAKSSISEDIVIIRETIERLDLGRVESISGASGGIKYIPKISKEDTNKFVQDLCKNLNSKERIVPGNFIYINDIMFNPKIVSKAATILSSLFEGQQIDHVVTVETKGIPLAYEVSKNLGVELIIVRRDTKVTEGPTVSINYVSGSSGRIQNMSLSKKSLKKGSKCIFIDDFMKGGGTAKGIMDLLKEFESELLGIGVLIDNIQSDKKVIKEYFSIIEFLGINEDESVLLKPSNFIK
ncbi:pur operon repressor [Clostridium algidicarnis]|uniref:Purine operon repressor PurR n=2 Tax=Clostridium algidicarnis TaxID=37659 RepID=A0A2S6FZ29_9CLOT|nr:pur operon repressor [Clostridium algidicarnis]MBB6630113.1 pur operon repressor [Clostridium algidicarnis]MBB6696883.1 pur operon repressor [Clostridium algidicarnis]MBU3193232.1 pur operon repressor [Clostridium algidicarnis]MBU3204588.1 pur operon repressor [Clostridium algidicarnis]MBU3206542.1 pur operon repressor [Clostridium algidicarnis]